MDPIINDPMKKEDFLSLLEGMKTDLTKSITDDLDAKAKKAAEDKIAEKMNEVIALETAVKNIQETSIKAETIESMKNDLNIAWGVIDKLQMRQKDFLFKANADIVIVPSLGDALKAKLEEGDTLADLEKALKTPAGSFVMKLGKVSLNPFMTKDMTTSGNLTGTGVVTYNQRQAIIPAQKINFRELIPTVESPTGVYATYEENAGATNNIALQTEGDTKGQNDYAFTQNVISPGYISGFATFTKQLLRNLPFMQGTLSRALMRDFFKKENASFFTTVSGAATGTQNAGVSPDDVKQLISLIGAQLDSNYNVSFVLVSNGNLARLITSTYSSGYYPGAGSVIISDNRGLTIFGVPIVGASWVTSNYALAIDSDYIERVEVEGMNIAFSFEEYLNFRQNKVTARVECQEAINLMRAESAFYYNLGAS